MIENTNDWRLETDDNNILWLTFDKQGESTNVLSSSVLLQLDDIITQIQKQLPRGLIIQSGKKSGFVAGADINEFLTVKNQQDALEIIQRGQKVFNHLEALSCPTLCLIDGFCMGGGTELALACDYRIALDESRTRIGLPEVKLGIHPGFGGVVRLTEIANPLQSLEMMLSGRALSARNAKSIGLVDLIQPKRQLKNAAIQTILKRPTKRQMPLAGKILSLPGVRQLVSQLMKREVAKKARKEHYPAPYALLDVWTNYYGNRNLMMSQEALSVANLIQGDTVRNLIRVFFLQTRLKGLGNKKLFQPQHVHVIGAGIMGGDIAAYCALKGLTVTLQDREPKFLSKAMQRANRLFSKKLKLTHERNAAIDRLIPDTKGFGVEKADVIIEAIFEDIEAKQAIYRDIEPRMKKDAVLATNTSSIPLETLATALKKPERLVGIHFFNPVPLMPLVEIVHSEKTDEKTVQQAAAFTRHIGKLPLPVKSAPGFLVNRILVPYLIEAVILHDEGIAAEAIDKAALDFGMPMGPVELADTVGLDICQSVAKNLSEAFGFDVPEVLQKLVAAKNLGKKTGRGFYHYKKGKAIKDRDVKLGDQDMIQKRLLYRLLNESAACIREKIVSDKDLLDAGVIFGTGFAPFTGGPLNYSEKLGIEDLQSKMSDLQQKYGKRFEPDSGWGQI